MAELFSGIDTKNLSEMVWSAMPPELLSNFNFLMGIAKTIGVLFVIYIVFLIVKAIIQARQALRIKSIEKNVVAINEKLTHLIDKKKSK